MLHHTQVPEMLSLVHSFVPDDVGVCAMFKLLHLASERQLRAIQVYQPQSPGEGTWSSAETLIRVRPSAAGGALLF